MSEILVFAFRGNGNLNVIKYFFEQGFKTVLDTYGNLDNVCYVTLAPEIENAMDVIKEFKKKNIKISVGKDIIDAWSDKKTSKNNFLQDIRSQI